jgi:HEAT repeat protein
VTRALYRLRSTDPHKRAQAIRKLKETLPDERRAEVVKALEPLLNDDDFFTRRDVIEALGVWGNKDTVPILLKAMREKDTRGEAMKALGRLKDERAAEPLAERLEEFFDRHEAAQALKSMGSIAEKVVIARLNHHELHVRITVCEILGAIGTKQSIPPLEKVIAAGKDIGAGENFIVAHTAEQALQAIKARQ